MTRGPDPEDMAGLLSEAEAETAKHAVDCLRGRDRDRFDAARAAFEDVSAETREEIAAAMEAELRENRCDEWQP